MTPARHGRWHRHRAGDKLHTQQFGASTVVVMDRDRWRELEPLLDQALDLPAEKREAWLRELGQRSPDVAAELQRLLASEAAADRTGFLTAGHAVRPDIGLEGLELGAYTLERPLGQGGMGSVWLAHRTTSPGEKAAVKLRNLTLASPTAQARFRREGSVLARLAHPGIARLLDAGVSSSGQPYLVMEYIDGKPIDVFAAEQTMGVERRLELFVQVLDAVGHAHEHRIVHRDLKPSNILVARDGTVKLLDFGIAKLLEPEAGSEQSWTTTDGMLMLTPEYAAPEQVTGGPVTPATDVYVLGTLLYVMLSGRHPTADGLRAQRDIVRALFEVQPVMLDLPDAGTIADKALRKQPRDRYQTISAFRDDVQRCLRHEPIVARRATLADRVQTFVRRKGGQVAGILRRDS
jgi:serine/threonine protein kinase